MGPPRRAQSCGAVDGEHEDFVDGPTQNTEVPSRSLVEIDLRGHELSQTIACFDAGLASAPAVATF